MSANGLSSLWLAVGYIAVGGIALALLGAFLARFMPPKSFRRIALLSVIGFVVFNAGGKGGTFLSILGVIPHLRTTDVNFVASTNLIGRSVTAEMKWRTRDNPDVTLTQTFGPYEITQATNSVTLLQSGLAYGAVRIVDISLVPTYSTDEVVGDIQ